MLIKTNSLPENIQYYRSRRIVSSIMKDLEAIQKSVLEIDAGYLSREGKKHNGRARLHLISTMQALDSFLKAEQIHQQREQMDLLFRQES